MAWLAHGPPDFFPPVEFRDICPLMIFPHANNRFNSSGTNLLRQNRTALDGGPYPETKAAITLVQILLTDARGLPCFLGSASPLILDLEATPSPH